MNCVDEILALIHNVPPFPKVAERVMELLKDSDITARQLAEVIQYDQAITANVLKICNAAYFGVSRKVNSLDDALVVIGHDTLKDIIMASCCARFFQGKVGAGYGFELGDMWRHSIATGIMSKLLAAHIKDVDEGSVFTAALLHDIGKRFLSTFVADYSDEIVKKVDRQHCTFVEAEKEILGIDHATLGALILEKWEFNQSLVAAVREHHNPRALEMEPLTALVALGNGLVISLGIGVGDNGLASELRGDGIIRFGITIDMLHECMADLLFEMEKACDLLKI